MNNNFATERQQVIDAVRATFPPLKEGATAQEARNHRTGELKAMREAEAAWFATQPQYASITVREDRKSAEIRDEWFGGNITVYRPEADWLWSAQDENEKRIKPGYINASSWSAGSGRSETTAAAVKQEAENRLKMMAVAVELLNEYNSVVIDWKAVENPFRQAERLKDEVARYREAERLRAAEEQRKAEARKNRKSA